MDPRPGEHYVEAAVGTSDVIVTCWLPAWAASPVAASVEVRVLTIRAPGATALRIALPVAVQAVAPAVERINGVTEIRLQRASS